MAQPLTTEQANAVYDILVEHCGASDGLFAGEFTTPRGDFVFHQTRDVVNEYRFMGALGFGGKFWNYNGRWYVTAYPEDVKARPELQERIDVTNRALAEIRKETAA